MHTYFSLGIDMYIHTYIYIIQNNYVVFLLNFSTKLPNVEAANLTLSKPYSI